MDAIEGLCRIEEIRQVKYRFLRCVDLKLWDDIGDMFTENATADYGMTGFGEPSAIVGRAEIVAFFRGRFMPDILTAHTASQPEVTVGSDTATGIWSLRDTVLATRHRLLVTGAAFDHDSYERGADARWRIAHTAQVGRYETVLSRDDMPSFKIISALGNNPSGTAHANADAR